MGWMPHAQSTTFVTTSVDKLIHATRIVEVAALEVVTIN
jgi:hypothetical protein